MGEIALEIAGDPREMREIAALAVTFRQPRKNAEDLRVALSAERCIERTNSSLEKCGSLRASGGTVAIKQLRFKRLGHVEPGILQQRHKVVGGRAGKRILEVEEAHFGSPCRSGSHMRLGEWKSRNTHA